LRLEIGPRDVAGDAVVLARRTGGKKESLPMAGLGPRIVAEMERMQADLLETARARREANSIRGATKDQFLAYMEGNGGFVYSGFCGRNECEAEIKEQTKATIRVLPDEEFRSPTPPTTCMWCGQPSVSEAVWSKAY
jgi:prolyl-tRNA synthetase